MSEVTLGTAPVAIEDRQRVRRYVNDLVAAYRIARIARPWQGTAIDERIRALTSELAVLQTSSDEADALIRGWRKLIP